MNTVNNLELCDSVKIKQQNKTVYSFSLGKQNHRKRKYFLHSSSFTFCVNLISYYYMRLCLTSNWPSKLLERKFETFLCGKHQRDKLVLTRVIIHVFICKCRMDYSLWFMIQFNFGNTVYVKKIILQINSWIQCQHAVP